MNTLETRVNSLELSMRRWRRAALGLGMVVVVFSTVAANQEEKTPELLKAKRILVVNDEGQACFQVTGSDYGGSVTVYGKEQKEAYSFSPGYMYMKNSDDKIIFGVEQSGSATARGNGYLYVHDAAGDPIMSTTQTKSDGKSYGYIQIHDKDGKNTMYGPSYR